MITRDYFGAVLAIEEVKTLCKFILDHYEPLNNIVGLLAVYKRMHEDGIFNLYTAFKDLIANLENKEAE